MNMARNAFGSPLHWKRPFGWLAISWFAAAAAVGSPAAVAVAAPSSCPDARVVFARGTNEAPGVGVTGQAFADSLQTHLGGRTVEVSPVDYPASMDFHRGVDGVIDAMNTISATASNCPDTRIVLGGYSQGAAVAAYTVTGSVPAGFVLPPGIGGPLPPAVVNHIAAVVLFGTPAEWIINIADNSAPPIAIDSSLSARTAEFCATGDPICAAGGLDRSAHSAYRVNGMVDEAGAFAANALSAG
jgi:cutinase-like protein